MAAIVLSANVGMQASSVFCCLLATAAGYILHSVVLRLLRATSDSARCPRLPWRRAHRSVTFVACVSSVGVDLISTDEHSVRPAVAMEVAAACRRCDAGGDKCAIDGWIDSTVDGHRMRLDWSAEAETIDC